MIEDWFHTLILQMVRNYIKKTNQPRWCPIKMKEATEKVKKRELSMRQAAAIYNVPYTTLQRRVSLYGRGEESDGNIKKVGARTILDEETETMLTYRLLNAANRGLEITPRTVRKYAFEIAERKNIKHCFNKETKMAGEDWYYKFIRRHEELNVLVHEAICLYKGNAKEMENEAVFLGALRKILIANKLVEKPESVYNADEIRLPMKYCRNCPVKGFIDEDRSTKVPILTCVNAIGQYIPPFVAFKGVQTQKDLPLHDNMPNGAEIVLTESGGITEETFKVWLKHFDRYRNKDNNVILILDPAMLISYSIVDLCESLGIEILLLPPNTSLKPLDAFFKSLRKYFDEKVNTWQSLNPDEVITNNVFGVHFKEAWNNTASVGNATEGFEKCGIYPLNIAKIPEGIEERSPEVSDLDSDSSFESDKKPTNILPDTAFIDVQSFSSDNMNLASTSTNLADMMMEVKEEHDFI